MMLNINHQIFNINITFKHFLKAWFFLLWDSTNLTILKK